MPRALLAARMRTVALPGCLTCESVMDGNGSCEDSTYSTSATESRATATVDPDRPRHRDPAPAPRADEPRLSRDPQADRAVLLCRPPARQGAGRDVAAIRAAVPRLFHEHHHARIAGRAGAGREFGQSGGSHLL